MKTKEWYGGKFPDIIFFLLVEEHGNLEVLLQADQKQNKQYKTKNKTTSNRSLLYLAKRPGKLQPSKTETFLDNNDSSQIPQKTLCLTPTKVELRT